MTYGGTVWHTTDGRNIPFGNLSTEHLCNILNQMERREIPSERSDDYFNLRREAMARSVRWRNYKGMKLHDGDLKQSPEGRNWYITFRYHDRHNPAYGFLIGKPVKIVLRHSRPQGKTTMYGVVEELHVIEDSQLGPKEFQI